MHLFCLISLITLIIFHFHYQCCPLPIIFTSSSYSKTVHVLLFFGLLLCFVGGFFCVYFHVFFSVRFALLFAFALCFVLLWGEVFAFHFPLSFYLLLSLAHLSAYLSAGYFLFFFLSPHSLIC